MNRPTDEYSLWRDRASATIGYLPLPQLSDVGEGFDDPTARAMPDAAAQQASHHLQ